jgi:short-subunit dehydrogenase
MATAWLSSLDPADRKQVAGGQEQLAERHADANLLVNSAGFLVPKPLLTRTVRTTTRTSS